MADDLSFDIQGLEPVLAKMKELESLPKKKATRFALRKAANLVRDRARANAQRLDDPETANSIADNIAVRQDTKHYRRTGDLKMSVGVRGGATMKAKNAALPGGDTFYWRFLEFGTERSRAIPFMRPALAESIDPATDEFVRQLDRAIDRAIKRARKGK
ncbi:HK97-gp10 family putative phage morphogenesis protein [Halomonas elongata]|uniref:HK97-gp10 family putative phage morphogenesis protein n=1 Tax=Halomonas elongata TaxID=2746 RepID=UPI00186BAA11|nr:HK97-gp10 family putative phage morphogenesis protein [Halomonas elongata]MBW5800063.1 HK97 gp10 family phage protein [Halomonas elongata]